MWRLRINGKLDYNYFHIAFCWLVENGISFIFSCSLLLLTFPSLSLHFPYIPFLCFSYSFISFIFSLAFHSLSIPSNAFLILILIRISFIFYPFISLFFFFISTLVCSCCFRSIVVVVICRVNKFCTDRPSIVWILAN